MTSQFLGFQSHYNCCTLPLQMIKDTHHHYSLVAQAMHFIDQKQIEQPSLEAIAKKMNLSPFHFQRIFEEWAGVSPKKILQYINIKHAKKMLQEKSPTLFDVTHQIGLSSTGRLHNLFIKHEGMTPGEFKKRGQNINIEYSFLDTQFGKMLVASTSKGICYLAYFIDKSTALELLKTSFLNANFSLSVSQSHLDVLSFLNFETKDLKKMKLDLKGTDFQLKVWQALLEIPLGNITTYKDISIKIGKPSASRAVGTAIGKNPIAYLIPCHRVIQSSGAFGGYMWGEDRKKLLLGWELSRE